jgi:hypothetical protein
LVREHTSILPPWAFPDDFGDVFHLQQRLGGEEGILLASRKRKKGEGARLLGRSPIRWGIKRGDLGK